MEKSPERRALERRLREAIQLGMVSGELPQVDCPECGLPIVYGVYREEGRIVSLTTSCPCGYSNGGIYGL